MSPDENKRVTEFFDAAARDWPSPEIADRVLYVPVSTDPGTTLLCASVLADTELQRANRFVTNEGRSNFIQRRAFRRYCGAAATVSQGLLSQISFCESDNGRPYLSNRPDLWFTFSSCRLGFVGAWSSTHAIGVDIEDQNVQVEVGALAQTYFTASEARTVRKSAGARQQTFLSLWSLKEAALKSIGEGLPFGLAAFEFDIDGRLRVVSAPADHGGPHSFQPYLFGRAGISAALIGRKLQQPGPLPRRPL
jgi:4'-phosphopantetheinyl transferase